jgi:hypothetical protein
MKSIFLIFFLTFIGLGLNAQTNYTISGNIKDASTGEDLIGATVRILDSSNTGTGTNVYGFYSLTLPEGKYSLKYSYIGYESKTKVIELNKSILLNLELNSGTTLKEFEVTSERDNDNITQNVMSITKLTPKDIESIPVLFGEKDVIKVLQLTPGVKSAGEGNSGFFVRGGAADQNLIILDEAPVYNASHLLGFFSVFNSDVIKDLTLYKGGMPAKYGGRASSVLDIKLIDGNSKKLTATGGIGLISSRLTIEAPIVKNKGSFVISGRRTYADLFLKLSKNAELKNNTLYFYDLVAKANYTFGKKDRIFVSGYLGRDKLAFGNQFSFDWGNKTGTIRWNHIYNDKLFSNTSLIFSDYSYKIKVTGGNQSLVLSSLIRDINLKQDYSYYLNQKHTLEFGGNIIYHKFLPGNLDAGQSSSLKLNNKHALESALYIQDNYKVSELLSLSFGLRYSNFNYVGPSTKYVFNEGGTVVTKKTYDKWKSIQQYHGLEPRINATYQLSENSSVKASYNRNYQYMHLLSNSTSTQPNDLWVPSTNNIKPLIADQVALGYFKNLNKNAYHFSVEAYYKNLQNQLDYKDGANLFLNETVENQLVFGKGYAYGVELLIKKVKGDFSGWIGYTYSRSFKKIPLINQGNAYPAKQDRIHDISIVGMYNFTPRIKLAATWVFSTGNAVTFPSGKYTVNNQVVPLYTERNGYRMPNYHRLDVGLTLNGKNYKTRVNSKTGKKEKIKRKIESSWNFSVYNAYARANAYTITFRPKAGEPNKTEAVQTSLFKIVPSISYNFKF